MQPTRSVLAVVLLVALSACRAPALPSQSKTIDASSAATRAQVKSTPSPSPSSSPIPLTLAGSPTATLRASTTSAVISTPATAQSVLARISFSPWELVTALARSPDGSELAVAAGESIYLYTASTLQERLKIDVHTWSTSLGYSPDGNLLASGSRDGRLRLFDTASGALRLSLAAHKKGVNSLAFSPDGLWLATGGNDAVARVWEVASGKKLAQLIGGTFVVPAVAFSRDGTSLAIVNGPVIRLRDVQTTRFIQTFRGESPYYSLALSPNGLTLAAGTSSGTVDLWDLGSGDLQLTLRDPALTPGSPSLLTWSVAFSPDGQALAAAGSDGRIRVWDVSDGKLRTSWAAHARAVTCLAFSPDGGVLASGGLDASVNFWPIK